MDNENKIKTVLDIVAKKNDIQKWRHERKIVNEEALNFVGNITSVTLINEDTGEVLDIFIKIAPQIQSYEVIVSEFYRQEIYFYNTLRLIMENNIEINLEELIPKCYYADSSIDNRVVVLKDMTSIGFRRHKGDIHLDEDHMMVSLQAVATFHSISMILSEKNVKIPNNDILKPYVEGDPAFYCNSIRFVMKKYLFMFEGMQCEKFMNNLCLHINSTDFLNTSVKEARRLVYGHGDMWKENFLFKYSETQPGKPVQVCLVDYQQTRIMSPAWDVLYLIMSCTESSVRRQHYKAFVTNYYQTLQQILHSNALDLETLYPEEDFNLDLKLVFPSVMGLTLLSYSMWLPGLENPDSILCEVDSVPVHENLETFKQIIENIFLDFKDFGFIGDNDQPITVFR